MARMTFKMQHADMEYEVNGGIAVQLRQMVCEHAGTTLVTEQHPGTQPDVDDLREQLQRAESRLLEARRRRDAAEQARYEAEEEAQRWRNIVTFIGVQVQRDREQNIHPGNILRKLVRDIDTSDVHVGGRVFGYLTGMRSRTIASQRQIEAAAARVNEEAANSAPVYHWIPTA